MVRQWRPTVEEIGCERFEAALDVVTQNSEWFPDISKIRKVAGVNTGIVDPTEKEALAELTTVIQAMRKYSPSDRTILGPKQGPPYLHAGQYVYDTTPAIEFLPRCEAAIAKMGLGDRKRGLEALAAHPALGYDGDPSFRMKAAKEIEVAWIQVWRQG